jgi:hypothetical protein
MVVAQTAAGARAAKEGNVQNLSAIVWNLERSGVSLQADQAARLRAVSREQTAMRCRLLRPRTTALFCETSANFHRTVVWFLDR